MSNRNMTVNRVNQRRLPRGGGLQGEWDLDCLKEKEKPFLELYLSEKKI